MVRINEDYVSFETAKLLREKGFDWGCSQYWYEGDDKLVHSQSMYPIQNISNPCFFGPAAPTLQMAMKWLREEHNLNVCFRPVKFPSKVEWRAYIFNKDCEPLPINVICGKAYEEACDTAIKCCLENLI